METNDNENKMTQNLLDSINSPKRDIAIHVYLKKQEKYPIKT